MLTCLLVHVLPARVNAHDGAMHPWFYTQSSQEGKGMADLGGGRHAQGVQVASEAGAHLLAAPSHWPTGCHKADILNTLPEQLAPVIYTPLILQAEPALLLACIPSYPACLNTLPCLHEQ